MKIDPGIVADVTETLADLAREDRVFRTASGYVIKVKCVLERHASPHGGHVSQVTLSGSVCGEDGKALRHADGSPAVWALGQGHTFKADGDDDPMAELQASRVRCVFATIRAEKADQAMFDHIEGDVVGLVSAEQFQRKREGAKP